MVSGSVKYYGSILNSFVGELENQFGGSFEEFSTISRAGFILGCENRIDNNLEPF